MSAENWLARLRRGWPGLAWREGSRHARIVEALPLGPGNRLLVVEFGGRRLLIGQGRTGLVRLAEAEA